MSTGGARWRELDGPTFWILATLLAGYLDYRALATHAVAMQILLFVIILLCCWQMSESYDQLLEAPSDDQATSAARSRRAGLHMIASGAVLLAVIAAAALLEQKSLSGPGQGRLLLFGGVLGAFLIRTGLRLR